jgi:type IV secretion system protein VirD4
VDKIFWYREPVFQRRANLPVPVIADQRIPANTIAPDISETLHFAGAVHDQALDAGVSFEVGFSPNRNALEVVMSLILQAERELLVAAYSFTSKPIAFALSEAKDRGVDVRLVVDEAQNAEEQGGYKAVDFLVSRSIHIVRSSNYAAMHHKFMVTDGQHVQLGSFNYTASANSRNAETAVVLRNAPGLAQVYRTEWLRLANEPKVSTEDIMRVDSVLGVLHDALGI